MTSRRTRAAGAVLAQGAVPVAARNPPHLENIPALAQLPAPWRVPGSPGAFIEQFQGDAIGVPGFSSTTDLNLFRTYVASRLDPRTTWVQARLSDFGFRCATNDVAVIAAAIARSSRPAALARMASSGPRRGPRCA